jgi:ABC-type glutathione transport system ATPase component
MPTSTTVDILNLSVGFDECELILKNCNLSIKNNSITALVGSSGSGKSTLAYSIARLLDKKAKVSGSIVLDGTNILELKEEQIQKFRKNISFIFQNPSQACNPLHKIKDIFSTAIGVFQTKNKKEVLDITTRLLKDVGLNIDILNRIPHQCSGGQLQRVMIALSLINKPKIIIADEPTTALDTVSQRKILDLLKKINQKYNVAILLISHDIKIIKYMADFVYILSYGKIIRKGGVEICDYFDEEIKPLKERTIKNISTNTEDEVLKTYDLSVEIESKSWLKVWKKNNKKKLLQNINIAIKDSSSIGVIGASGSGKTTLGKAIIKLIPSKGEISIFGIDINKISGKKLREIRPNIQYIMQNIDSSLNPKLTIRESLSEGLLIKNSLLKKKDKMNKEEIEKSINDILASVNIEKNILHKYPNECSGGQKQRISIARSIIVGPKIIILDEPTSSLDTKNKNTVLNLLSSLQKKYKLSYIFITHDFSVVEKMCKYAVVLDEGKIVEENTVKLLLSSPKHTATKNLIDAQL